MKIKLLKKLRKKAKSNVELKYVSERSYVIRAFIYRDEDFLFGKYRFYNNYGFSNSEWYFDDDKYDSIKMYYKACRSFISIELNRLLAIRKTNKFKKQLI